MCKDTQHVLGTYAHLSLHPHNKLRREIVIIPFYRLKKGLPSWLDSKESLCSAGNPGLVPELGRSPGEGNGNRLQYSCLENPMDRGAWQATVHNIAKSRTRLSNSHTQMKKLRLRNPKQQFQQGLLC